MSKLTLQQQRFIEEYLIDLNATQAATRAGYSAKTARSQGQRLLTNVDIQQAIQDAQSKLSKRTKITQDQVLERLWAIATANPNELIQHRRVNCRYCWGTDHYYQWRNQVEYQGACEAARRARPKHRIPDCDGGFGFDPIRPPHPDCPDCRGEGLGQVFIGDTCKLTGKAALLYAGVKEGQYGIEVKMHDQMAALAKVGQHLGLFKEKIEHDVTDPVKELLQQIMGNTLKPKG